MISDIETMASRAVAEVLFEVRSTSDIDKRERLLDMAKFIYAFVEKERLWFMERPMMPATGERSEE